MGLGEGSGAGCGSGCLKCILILLNLVFGLIGIVFLAIGIFIYYGLDKIANSIIGSQLSSLNDMMSGLALQGGSEVGGDQTIKFSEVIGDFAIPFIVIGAIIFAVAICGCCGACCNSKWALITYMIICGAC